MGIEGRRKKELSSGLTETVAYLQAPHTTGRRQSSLGVNQSVAGWLPADCRLLTASRNLTNL